MRDTEEILSGLLPFALLAGVCGLCVYLVSSGEFVDQLRYERSHFALEKWRLVTSAFVHANAKHLALNLSALVLTFLLFNEAFRSLSWVLVLVGSAAISSVGLYYFSPDINWCLGLSGALHGLLVYALLRTRASLIWLFALAAKIVAEQMSFFHDTSLTGLSESFIGVPIVTDAHLWGAIGGFVLFAILQGLAWIRVVIEINSAKNTS